MAGSKHKGKSRPGTAGSAERPRGAKSKKSAAPRAKQPRPAKAAKPRPAPSPAQPAKPPGIAKSAPGPRATASKNPPSKLPKLVITGATMRTSAPKAEARLAPAAAPAQDAGDPMQQAMAHFHAGRLGDASAICERRIAELTDDFGAHHLLGVIRLRQGNFARACELIQRAVNLRPGDAQAQQNLGSLLALQGRLDEAATCYSRAIALEPRQADAHANLGLLLQNRNQLEAAIACFRRAIEINPDHAEAHNRLGMALRDQKQIAAAIAETRRALEIRPTYTEALSNLLLLQRHACDWADLAPLEARLDQLTRAAIAQGRKTGEQVFHSVVRSPDPARNLVLAKASAAELLRHLSSLRLRFPHDRRRGPRPKLTLGYLSGDFRAHPVAHLVRGLFRAHDRNRFRVFTYSYGPDDGSSYRADIAAGSDQFIELRNMNAADCARRIYQDNVDILIDLAGFTGGNRMEIAALRPAPVQVAYLGFPGSTGAPFFDYVVVDRTVMPAGEERYYSEQPIIMPHSYQVNDASQPISAMPFSRSQFGLPAKGFVFCCFNNTYKIEPVMFDLWMRLLRQVPGSVLWLLKSNDVAEANLKREAQNRDIAAERLVFTGKLPKDEHLARIALADLAIDTRIYNGHTTTSDALWAGLPVVALRGTHFASRVAASLLEAVGLPELITSSLAEYEALAIRLAGDREALSALRAKLQRQRQIWPLFDTARFVRNLEAAFTEAWVVYEAGDAPRSIEPRDPAPAAPELSPGLRARP